MTDAGTNEGARGSSWTESNAGETVAVAHAESSRSVVVDDEVRAAEQWSQGPDDSRAGRRTVSDGTTDEVVVTADDETVVVVVVALAAVHKSTTDGDRTIVDGDESSCQRNV